MRAFFRRITATLNADGLWQEAVCFWQFVVEQDRMQRGMLTDMSKDFLSRLKGEA